MTNQIRFALALHNHQPVGNFDHVFEQAYQESYLPFLDVFSRYDDIRLSLHTSGSLIEWLAEHHPEYLDRLAELVNQGRIEVIGGPFFEPILAMLPSRDRVGQIRAYTEWLQRRLGATVRGMWMPERIWEQSYVRDLATAGMEYTIVDDYHFKKAGLRESELAGYYTTEDDGHVMSVFPGSERLRYLIPFGTIEHTLDYFREMAETAPNLLLVFGDDGEKFGTWPGTHKHVYTDGWLDRFFRMLSDNQDWIQTLTLSGVMDSLEPKGKVYLPDCSYREMTEWALPAERLVEYEKLVHEMESHPHWEQMSQYIRGGYWRNFKVKYPESDEMYSRMMYVSRRIDEATEAAQRGEPMDTNLLNEARTELYRGQCNCSYWHGAFGGIYLPHLRNAVYEKLISADNLLDRAKGLGDPWVEASAEDYNFDGHQEIRLAGDRLFALIEPMAGGRLYELDVRSIRHNLLATLARRYEAYHEKVLAGETPPNGECTSIHDLVVFKQKDLDKRVQYDDYRRKSMIDLFYDADVSLESVVAGTAENRGDFRDGAYEARIRRNPDRIQVQLTRQGVVYDNTPIRITKGISLAEGSSTLEIAYLLEDLPQGSSFHFASEFNFAGMPAGADDRYFHDLDGNQLGQLGTKLDLNSVNGLGLVDEWLGLGVELGASRETNFWTFPIETVSQSEGGFELVHQSVVVLPHWHVTPDAEGRWSVTLRLGVDTSRAENNNNHGEKVAVGV
ncbi:MAG: DUF1926 domain-containing protein [Planctomycetia bacterium]|jgi:alpha-amylase